MKRCLCSVIAAEKTNRYIRKYDLQKQNKTHFCLPRKCPLKSSNCFLFQVTLSTCFTATCWTSNRDVLCSEPLSAERWSAARWRLSDVFALGISLEDVYKCHYREHNGKKGDWNQCFEWHTELNYLLICWVHKWTIFIQRSTVWRLIEE